MTDEQVTYIQWWVEREGAQYSDYWFWSHWHVVDPDPPEPLLDDWDRPRTGLRLLCGRYVVDTHNAVMTNADPRLAGYLLPPGKRIGPSRAPFCGTCALRQSKARASETRASPAKESTRADQDPWPP